MKFAFLLFYSLLLFSSAAFGQEYRLVNHDTITQIKFYNGYYIENSYVENHPNFLYSRGGFLIENAANKVVQLEFNSLYSIDSLSVIEVPDLNNFTEILPKKQILDGAWLMGGRKNKGTIQMRDTSGTRKTLKLLFNGTFQWIAFNTESYAFLGTGGGSFTTNENKYVERIEFFSRDNSRVGALLSFNFELENGAWHHMGSSSKGEPIYEIWKKRMR